MDPKEVLYQKEAYIRHYTGKNTHYIFDNVNMSLYEVADFPADYLNSKFVPGNLFNLPERQINERGSYSMYYAVFELTRACNLRCAYCYRQREISKDFMTMETADAIIEYIIRLDKEKNIKANKIGVCFYGGEPLMNMPVLKHVVERLKNSVHNYPLYFNLITNGLLLSGKNLEYLIENNIATKVSFEGDETLQGKLRPSPNGKNVYKIINANLDKISDEAKYLFVLAPSVSRFAGNLDTIVKNYAESGFKRYSFQFIVDDIIGKNNIRPEDMEKLSKIMDEVIRIYIDLKASGVNIKIFPILNYMICLHERTPQEHFRPTINMEVFSYDGSIYPCSEALSNKDYCYGNVYTGYNREKRDKLRDFRFFASDCKDCWMKHFCSGQSFIYSESTPQNDEKRAIDCLMQNLLWESAIKGYIQLKENTSEFINIFFN